MNRLLVAAACFSLLICVAHIIGGGAQYHSPVLAGSMAPEAKAVYSIIWHFATLVMAVNTVVLFSSAFSAKHHSAAALVAAQYFAFAGVFVLFGVTRLGSLFVLPQWTIFVAIAVMALLGLRQDRLSTQSADA